MTFRRVRFITAALLVAASLPAVAANSPAHATTTYYVDTVAGDDANAGTSRAAAWRTLAKAYVEINDAVIVGGDTILIRSGRYYVRDGPTGTSLGSATQRIPGVSGQIRGGTAGNPVTFSVDTNYAGDVEITGSLPGNWNTGAGKTFDRTIAWTTVASECTGSTTPWACCTGSGTGCANVWYSTGPATGGTTGTGAGVCFQPGSDPGDTPTMWEILYSSATAPVTLPTFTASRNQCWIRTEYANFCTATDEPYDCCTGAGAGATCLGTVRVYAQAATGGNPGSLSPPVEFPVAPNVIELGRTDVVQYLTFSNADNGRTFYWRWGVTKNIHIRDAHHLTFEDFEVGYNSGVHPKCGSGSGGTCAASDIPMGTRSGSGFPRDTGGPAWLIVETENSTTDNHTNQTYRRGVILRPQGDEGYHQGSGPLFEGDDPASCATIVDCTQTSLGTAVLCTDSVCYYHDHTTSGSALLEDLEFTDQPWEVLNGDTSLYGYAYSWPPTGYSAWNAQYSTHFSPLGGGGQSPGSWIIQGANNILRRIYVHNADGKSSFEVGMSSGRAHSWPAGNLVEQSIFDGTQLQYASSGGPDAGLPYCATCKCKNIGACGGFGANHFVKDAMGGWDIDQAGTVWRNNIFRNCYGACWTARRQPLGSGRATAPQFVNNTLHSVGDHTLTSMNNARFAIEDKWGTAAAKGTIKNNIFVQDNVGTARTFQVDRGSTTTVDIDYNLYGAANNRWNWGGVGTTTVWATWKANGGQDAKSPAPADPMFRGPPPDLHIRAGSPAVDAGATLADFSNGHDGVSRPHGVAWDIGAYEVLGGPDPPTLRSLAPLP